MKQAQMELLRMYGQEKMIWLERSPLADKLTVDGCPFLKLHSRLDKLCKSIR